MAREEEKDPEKMEDDILAWPFLPAPDQCEV